MFGTPPVNPATFIPPLYSLTGSIDQMASAIAATSSTYTESAPSFMVPPDLEHLRALRRHGGRMLVYHGVSDPIFSAEDTRHWYDELARNTAVESFARLYLVPGMGHCAGGPATDQFDLLTPLVRWWSKASLLPRSLPTCVVRPTPVAQISIYPVIGRPTAVARCAPIQAPRSIAGATSSAQTASSVDTKQHLTTRANCARTCSCS